jgi:NAD-specific glutamate dehydrogenase
MRPNGSRFEEIARLHIAKPQACPFYYNLVSSQYIGSTNLVLSGITNKTFRVGERNVTRRSAVTLVVGNDFNFAMLKDSDARIGGSEVNSDRWCFGHFAATIDTRSKSYKYSILHNFAVNKM